MVVLAPGKMDNKREKQVNRVLTSVNYSSFWAFLCICRDS